MALQAPIYNISGLLTIMIEFGAVRTRRREASESDYEAPTPTQ